MEAAVSQQAQVDAGVMGQLPRRHRSGRGLETQRRGGDDHAGVGRYADRDHVLLHLLAEAHAGVETLRNDIGQGGFRVQLDLDVGVVLEQLRQDGPEDRIDRVLARRDPEASRRLVPKFVQGREHGLDVADRRAERAEQTFARFSGRDAAGGAGQQTHAEPRLQPPHRIAQRRL